MEDLCLLTKNMGEHSIAVTDINNTSACMNFIKMAPEFGIKPFIGIDFRNGVQQQYVGLAKNNEGFRQSNEHLSHHLHQGKLFENQTPELSNCYFIYPFEMVVRNNITQFLENEFIGISVETLRRLKFSEYLKLQDRLVLLQTVTFRNKKD